MLYLTPADYSFYGYQTGDFLLDSREHQPLHQIVYNRSNLTVVNLAAATMLLNRILPLALPLTYSPTTSLILILILLIALIVIIILFKVLALGFLGALSIKNTLATKIGYFIKAKH